MGPYRANYSLRLVNVPKTVFYHGDQDLMTEQDKER